MPIHRVILGSFLLTLAPSVGAVAQVPDGIKPFTLPEYSCPVGDSLLGGRRKSAAVKSRSGDATYATFLIPSNSSRGLNGRLHLQVSLGALSAPALPPPPIDLAFEIEGAALHTYRRSPHPHPLELTVDDSVRLTPVLSEVDLSGPQEFAAITVGARIPGGDAVRLARGHRLVVHFLGIEDHLDDRFLDQLNMGYRASLCGLAAGWPDAGDAVKTSRVPVKPDPEMMAYTYSVDPHRVSSRTEDTAGTPVNGVYQVQQVSVIPKVLVSFPAEYPPDMQARGISGNVTLEFTIDSLGTVDSASITVIRSTNAAFEPSAIHAVARTRFEPGRIGDRRVAVALTTRLDFTTR